MELRDIIRNNVTLQAGGPTSAAFGIKTVMSPHTIFTERIKSYGSATEMLKEGWNIGDPAYDAVAKAYMQKKKPNEFKVGRIQVDVAKGTVAGSGPLTVGTVYAYESADLADAAVTDISYTVAAVSDASSDAGSTGAGTSSLKFFGNAADALMYRTGYTFSYSGDTTTAANATYTVKAPGAAEVAGTVTVPVVETIAAATWDGNLTVNNDKYAVAAGLVTAHTASALLSTAVDNSDGSFSLTTSVAGEAFIFRSSDTARITVAPQTLGGTGATDAAKWVTSLNAIKAADENFYGMIDTSRTDAISIAVAGWAETETSERLYFNVDDNADIKDLTSALDTASVPAVLKSYGYDRTRCLYNSKASGASTDEWYDAASITQNIVDIDTLGLGDFYGKDMTGITPESLSTTQRNNLAAKDVDWCDSVGGFTSEYGGVIASGGGGRVISGKPARAVVASDYFSIRMREAIFGYKHTANQGGGVPFTQQSLNGIQSTIEGVINNCIRLNVFAPDYTTYGDKGYYVKFPTIDEVTSADKTANILRGIDIQASSPNGIHFVYNNITIAYS